MAKAMCCMAPPTAYHYGAAFNASVQGFLGLKQDAAMPPFIVQTDRATQTPGADVLRDIIRRNCFVLAAEHLRSFICFFLEDVGRPVMSRSAVSQVSPGARGRGGNGLRLTSAGAPASVTGS